MSDKEEPKVFAVPFVLSSQGTAYVLADSADAAEQYVAELSAEDLQTLEATYSVETDTAEEEDGEEWDFNATDRNYEDADDDDDLDDEDDEEEDECEF